MERRVLTIIRTIPGGLLLLILTAVPGLAQGGSGAGSGGAALGGGSTDSSRSVRRPAKPVPAPGTTEAESTEPPATTSGESSPAEPKVETQAAGGAKRPAELVRALEEFRVQIGKLGDGSKSNNVVGGRQNSLTGRLYEYLRNDLMDAIPHQVRQFGGNKNLLRRNQYGATVSGPVRLPWLYDGRGRTFFSFSFEGTRERISQSTLLTLPTDRQREGDFSDLVDNAGIPVTIYDPATTRPNPAYDPRKPISIENLQYLRDPFPGNRVPLARRDPVAQALVALYPRANSSIGPFLLNNYWINSPFENRADGIISKLDHTLNQKQQVSLSLNYSRGLRKSPEYFPGPANSGAPNYSFDNGSLAYQHNYTATPQIVWTFRGSASYSGAASLGSDDKTNYPARLGLPGTFSNYFPRFYLNQYVPIGPPTAVFKDRNYVYTGSTSVAINRKDHNLTLTAFGQRRYVNSYSPSFPAGLFYFGNNLTGLPGVRNTGNTFASFLLGMAYRAEQAVIEQPSYYRNSFFEVNLGEQYRMRPGWTGTLSLSIETAMPRIEKYDRQSTVALDRLNPANNRPGALIFAGRDGVGRALQPTTVRVEPGFGLAVNPWNNRFTVIRINYNLTYDNYPLYGRHFGTQGFNAAPVFFSANEQLQPALYLREGLPQNFPRPPFLDATAANGTDADYIDRSGHLPSNHQWNVSFQRELPNSMALEARYNGWRSQDIFVDGMIRLNAIPLEYLKYGEQLYDDAFRNSLRPYPQYRNLDLGGLYPAGDLEGHSLTLTMDQRLSGGLFGRATYRFAKVLDNYSSGVPQDPANLAEEWSISTSDIRHSLQVSYTYELPFGKGKWLFADDEMMARLLGGWSLSGLTTIRGGTPLMLRPLFNRTGGLVGNLRVNLVPGVNPRVENPTAERWFNPEAFAQPDDFTLGNGPRTHPQLRGPGEQFHHLSLTKRIELTSDASLEFVTEAFNFPNLANLNDPDTRIGSDENPNLNAGRIIGSTGGRVMQVGLRILF
ncbi:MAG: hypothetical protein ACOYLF_06075 [Blastocatellia bacterium]